MSLKEWLTRFQAHHAQARAGTLDTDGWAAYRAGREELARALMAAQRASLKPGELARQLRVARALQADLDLADGKVRAVTLDVSADGFGALLARAPPLGEVVAVQLRLLKGEPVRAKAKVTGVQKQGASARVSFTFAEIGGADRDRVEMLVFDTVLSQINL